MRVIKIALIIVPILLMGAIGIPAGWVSRGCRSISWKLLSWAEVI